MDTVIKTFRYRAYCSDATAERLQTHLNLTRNLYNQALAQRKEAWEKRKESISCYDQQRQLTELRNRSEEFRKVACHVEQATLQRLDRAFQSFFRRCKNGETPGYPRFKSKNRWDSLKFPDRECWSLDPDGEHLHVRNVGTFRMEKSRPLEGDPCSCILVKSAGKIFVCIVCRNVPKKPLPHTGKSVGVDLGLKKFLATSDGQEIENPRHLKKGQKRLTKAQQRLSRKKQGSTRRKTAKRHVQRAHEKIRNQRRDFHFKIARWLIEKYDKIVVEDLKPSEMDSWRSLNRSKGDAAWGQFLNILSFKAEEAGKKVVKVDPADTTKICSNCGHVKDMPLSARTYSCPLCGAELDRDINAARNIRARAGPAAHDPSDREPQSVSVA